MRTDSLRGLPTLVLTKRALMACAAAAYRASGTKTRRMAVHFWPDFTVISRATSLASKSKDSLPAASPGKSNAEFRLSASMFTRTECCVTAGCERITAAVSADPVNDRTSKDFSWSSRPAELPQMTDRAPAGRMPASTTSRTMRCVSQAVAVAGLMMTGTPESRAGAAFSHRPQEGKLKALMKRASPRVGHRMCWLWNNGSLPRRAGSPSRRKWRSPSVSPILAYRPRVKMPPSMSTAESFLTVPLLAVAMS